ncbi:MAG: hypothetical protein ACEPOV_09185 [Hyphomicrobiales bacterium]
MKINLRYKPFVSSLKKFVLKFKDKITVHSKKHSSITQTNNVNTIKPVKQTQINQSDSLNGIDILFSVTDRNIDKKKTIATKYVNHINTKRGTVKNKIAILCFNTISKHKIFQDIIYHKKLISS